MRFMNPFRSFRDHHHFGHHFGGHHHHRGDPAEFLEFIAARASSKLDLNDKQQELLAALLKDAQAQRAAMKSGLPDSLKNLLGGESFDRATAQQLLDSRVDAIRAAGPGLINAAGDFFDSLDAEQKQALRFLLRTRSRRFS